MSERFTNYVVTTVSLVLCACFIVSAAQAGSKANSTVNLISRARKSVVSIESKVPLSTRMGAFGKALDKKLQNSDSQQSKYYLSMGSGVIWDNKGHIVTAKSNVESATEIFVQTADRIRLKAKLLGIDELTNLAVLRIMDERAKDLVPVAKRSRKLPEGSWLVLLGYGYENIPTVAPGMAGIPPEDFDPGRHWFQFTAPLRPGNTGGALMDADGQLAGVVLGREEDIGFNAVVKMLTGKNRKNSSNAAEYSNFGVAVPLSQASPVIEQIVRQGMVVRGWVGVSVRQLTDLTSGESMLIVVDVVPGSPADTAGLAVGDRIRCLNSEEVKSPIHLGRIIRELHPGSRVPVDFDRDDKHLRSEIEIVERPELKDLQSNSQPSIRKPAHQGIKILEELSADH